jgi:hypothetical protein
MRARFVNHRAVAFTLIELVISAAVGAMILTGAYLCLSAGFSSQKMIDPRVDAMQSGRTALALISADLRAACPLDKGFSFLGMHRALGDTDADNLDFATHNYTPRRDREGDYCEVSYFVQQDPDSGRLNLWRRRNPTLAQDPLAGGRREEIARGLLGVRFEYTDGLDWYDAWGETNSDKKSGLIAQEEVNLEGMPQAVRVTLSFPANPPAPRSSEDEEPKPEQPLVFQTVVRLELADAGNAASSGQGSSTTDTNSATESENGEPNSMGLPNGFSLPGGRTR